MQIPNDLIIHETDHWLINHRINSSLPGYLILSSKINTSELSQLPSASLNELGYLQAKVASSLEQLFQPKQIYISKYGHTPHLPIHFHIIPVYQWVEDLFWQDQRYRILTQFGEDAPITSTDGAELTLFIWREFCESKSPPAIQGQSTKQIISLLKAHFQASLE